MYSIGMTLGCLVALYSVASAGVLAPGALIPLSGTTFSMDPELGGFSQRDVAMPFEIRNAGGTVYCTGIVQESVALSSATGKLIFNRRFRDLVSTNGTARIVGLSATHFAGLETTADFRPDGVGIVAPATASRSVGTGDTVSFTFSGTALVPPDDSRGCFVKTNGNGWGLGATLVVSVEESPGGAVHTATIEDAARPYLLPTDRVVVLSVKQISINEIRIEWLSITANEYEIESTEDLIDPWQFERNRFGGPNPRQDTFFYPGSLTSKPGHFFQINEVP